MNISGSRGEDNGTGAEGEAEPTKEARRHGSSKNAKREKPRIRVVEEGDQPGAEPTSLPAPIENGSGLLPAVASLAASLSEAKDIPSLQVIHAQAVVLEEATKQFKVAFDQVV